MKAIILYATYSGNTEEVAELIKDELANDNVEAELFEITETSIAPILDDYDLIFFGTFSWDLGTTPDFVKDFISDVGYKPNNVFVFGTGETQFGEQYYCLAAEKISKFYNSNIDVLKIEQSPRGSQEAKVSNWTKLALQTIKEC